MRYLVFTNTPAHVHLYHNVVEKLIDEGHEILVLARDFGCTLELLEWYDLPYEVYGQCDTTPYSLFARLPAHYARILRTSRLFNPDIVFGMGGYAAPAGAVTGAQTIFVVDSEPTTIDHYLSRPVANAILTPSAFRKDLGSKHYVFDGFKEIAYLHPETFSPDSSVREELGVGDDPFAIVRFNAFGSHHDVGEGGFTPDERRHLITSLSEHVDIVVSDEGDDLNFEDLPARPFDAHPAQLHDALAEASLLVADTQTMVTEAALLGTPAVRSNSWVGEDDMGNFLELEEHDLIFNLRDLNTVLETTEKLLAAEDTAERWQHRRQEYLKGKVNLTDLLVDVATKPRELDSLDALSRYDDWDADDKASPEPAGFRS